MLFSGLSLDSSLYSLVPLARTDNVEAFGVVVGDIVLVEYHPKNDEAPALFPSSFVRCRRFFISFKIARCTTFFYFSSNVATKNDCCGV